MARKGKLPISLPKGVELKMEGNTIHVKGPKGELTQDLHETIGVELKDEQIFVVRQEENKESQTFHGLYRTLINNMVIGVSSGFEKKLEMIGVGYRAAVKGRSLDVQVGLSHPLLLDIPEGINVEVVKNTTIVLTGSDKQKIGQFAAKIRSQRPPEPYQGKGIRYVGEYVRRKAGKSASK